jgi:hypothetical protein
MARNITQIQQEMLDSIVSNEVLSPLLSSTSKYAVYRLFTYIVASAIWVLETLFDTHKAEFKETLANQKTGTLPWYRSMALSFQYGFDLLTDSDKFNNVGRTDEEIEASKIIKYSAVNDGDLEGVVIVKIATEENGVLAPISPEAKISVEAYFEEIKYAGTRVRVINYLADRLNLTIQIEVDALVIDLQGNSILDGGKPVETALNEFMKELPFNGQLTLQSLVDKLQKVEGVKIATVLEASSSWIDPLTEDYGEATQFNVKRIPESGYFAITTFDNITYVV